MPESTPETGPECPVDGQPPIPDPAAYDIALIRGRNVTYTKAPKHIQLSQLALVYGLMGAMFGVFKFTRHAAKIMLVPDSFLFILVGAVLVLAMLWFARWAVRSSAKEGKVVGQMPPFESGESNRRIRILTRPMEAIEMLRSIPGMRSGFEPEIARVPLAVGLDPAARRLAWLGGLLGLVSAIAFEFMFYRSITELSVTIWFFMGMTALGAIVLPEFVFPTYVRVIPGRLDVIRTPLFGNEFVTVKSFDLRHRHIILAGAVIFIEPERAKGEEAPMKVKSGKWPHAMMYPDDYVPDAVSLSLTPARKRLLLAALWAATTQAPTPDLPDDRLIG